MASKVMRGHVSTVVVGLVVLVAVGFGAVEAVHHVVGGDRGWDAANDVASWSMDRVFRVGDTIWFAYSAAPDNIVELGSREELESCNLTNPIRMYTGGLDRVGLDGEGPRYFSSSRPDGCHGGLKLHVQVLPQRTTSERAAVQRGGVAAGPEPSGTAHLGVSPFTVWIGLALLSFMAFGTV